MLCTWVYMPVGVHACGCTCLWVCMCMLHMHRAALPPTVKSFQPKVSAKSQPLTLNLTLTARTLTMAL